MRKHVPTETIESRLNHCREAFDIYGITFTNAEVMSDSRSAELTFIMALIVTILSLDKRLSLSDISACINRDHATALHLKGIKKIYGGRKDFKLIKRSLLLNCGKDFLQKEIVFHEKEILRLKFKIERFSQWK